MKRKHKAVGEGVVLCIAFVSLCSLVISIHLFQWQHHNRTPLSLLNTFAVNKSKLPGSQSPRITQSREKNQNA